MKRKQIAAGLLAGVSLMGTLVGCSAPTATQSQEPVQNTQQVGQEATAPKYVFLFIGDGMSYPQIHATPAAFYAHQASRNDYYEIGLDLLATLKAAYEKSIHGVASSEYEQEENVLYGTYQPLTVTLTHLINNKAGVNFASYSHTGLPVAVLAQGAGAERFDGYYDNTDIFHKMATLVGVK